VNAVEKIVAGSPFIRGATIEKPKLTLVKPDLFTAAMMLSPARNG
jgi:hypothetical protein